MFSGEKPRWFLEPECHFNFSIKHLSQMHFNNYFLNNSYYSTSCLKCPIFTLHLSIAYPCLKSCLYPQTFLYIGIHLSLPVISPFSSYFLNHLFGNFWYTMYFFFSLGSVGVSSLTESFKTKTETYTSLIL